MRVSLSSSNSDLKATARLRALKQLHACRNWDGIVAKLGGQDQAAVSVGRMFSRIAANFATDADLVQVPACTAICWLLAVALSGAVAVEVLLPPSHAQCLQWHLRLALRRAHTRVTQAWVAT